MQKVFEAIKPPNKTSTKDTPNNLMTLSNNRKILNSNSDPLEYFTKMIQILVDEQSKGDNAQQLNMIYCYSPLQIFVFFQREVKDKQYITLFFGAFFFRLHSIKFQNIQRFCKIRKQNLARV